MVPEPGQLGQSTLSSSSRACCNKCSRKPQLRVVQLNTGNNGHRSSRAAQAEAAAETEQQSRGESTTLHGVGRKHSQLHLDRYETLTRNDPSLTCCQGRRYIYRLAQGVITQ